jgi:hypothetical protein
MTARDRFSYRVRCPQRGKTGSVEASENDGWSYSNDASGFRIESLPPGFGRGSSKMKVACLECEVDADD